MNQNKAGLAFVIPAKSCIHGEWRPQWHLDTLRGHPSICITCQAGGRRHSECLRRSKLAFGALDDFRDN